MPTALLSVFNKQGIEDFARFLHETGWNIVASGGTAKAITAEKIPVIDVATLVGEPILGHRVVTLSREIHAGLLATTSERDVAELKELNIRRIDLVCVDLYPLGDEIAKPASTWESVIEMTDIGGPTMVRSAAKGKRIVVCDADDRPKIIRWLMNGRPNEEMVVRALMAKAELVVAQYGSLSGHYHINLPGDGHRVDIELGATLGKANVLIDSLLAGN